MQPQGKDHLEPPAAQRGRKDPPLEPEGAQSSGQRSGKLQILYKVQGRLTQRMVQPSVSPKLKDLLQPRSVYISHSQTSPSPVGS